MCNLCQFKFIEHFIVTCSLIAVPGEDAEIVLNKKINDVPPSDETDLSVTVLMGQTARLVMGTEMGGIAGG